MAARAAFFSSPKSIGGGALVGFGVFVLRQQVSLAASRAALLGRTVHGKGLGMVPSALLTVSEAVKNWIFDHPQGPEAVGRHLFLSLWPLLLVIVGAILATDDSPARLPGSCRKKSGSCRSSGFPFDV